MNTAKMMAQDLTPKSAPHWIRIVVSVLMILVALAVVVIKALTSATFDKNDVIIVVGFGGAGVAILFTNTVLEIGKAFLPLKKQ